MNMFPIPVYIDQVLIQFSYCFFVSKKKKKIKMLNTERAKNQHKCICVCNWNIEIATNTFTYGGEIIFELNENKNRIQWQNWIKEISSSWYDEIIVIFVQLWWIFRIYELSSLIHDVLFFFFDLAQLKITVFFISFQCI